MTMWHVRIGRLHHSQVTVHRRCALAQHLGRALAVEAARAVVARAVAAEVAKAAAAAVADAHERRHALAVRREGNTSRGREM